MRLREDWVIIEALADIIVAHPRESDYWRQPWKAKGCIVDIGAGSSTDVLAQVAKSRNLIHFTCDKNKFGKRHQNHRRFYMESSEFIDWFSKNLYLPSLVLLDGSHLYEDVKAEVECFLPMLLPGGVIFIHDTYPERKEWAIRGVSCGDIYKLRQELEKDPKLQVFTWPYTANNCGLTMIMKKYESDWECRQ